MAYLLYRERILKPKSTVPKLAVLIEVFEPGSQIFPAGIQCDQLWQIAASWSDPVRDT